MLRSEWWAQGVDERVPLLSVQTFWSATGPSFRPIIFRLLGRALARKPVPEGPRVYEPDSTTSINVIDKIILWKKNAHSLCLTVYEFYK